MSMKFIRIGTLPAHSSYALQLRAVITAEKAYHGQLNCVLAQVRSSLMASLRSHGALHVSVAESQKNVLPSLRIHISLCSHAPSSHRRKPTLNTCRWRNHRVCPLACVRFVSACPPQGYAWRTVSCTTVLWCRKPATSRWPCSKTKRTSQHRDLAQTCFK